MVHVTRATQADVFQVLATYKDSALPLRLAVGNTSIGVVKYYPTVPEDDPSIFINLAVVPELLVIDSATDPTAVSVGYVQRVPAARPWFGCDHNALALLAMILF